MNKLQSLFNKYENANCGNSREEYDKAEKELSRYVVQLLYREQIYYNDEQIKCSRKKIKGNK